MANISQNSQFNSFVSNQFSRVSRDQRLGPGEIRSLKRVVSQMASLSSSDKDAVNQFIDGLGDMTTHKDFFRTRRAISEVDMAVLQTVANDNPLTEQLLNQFQVISDPQAPSSPSIKINPDTPLEEVNEVSFGRPSNGVSQPQRITSHALQAMRPDWYLNQYNTGLPSTKGDCGPTSAAMIARSFGHQTHLSEKDAVALSRDFSGGPQSGPPWAIGVSQMSRAVNRLTGGEIREISQENYSHDQGAEVLQDIVENLARGNRPILLTGVPGPGGDNATFRHYMTAVGPDPSQPGNILFADPALGFQEGMDFSEGGNTPSENHRFTRSFSPDDINELITRARNIGRDTTVVYYGKGS